MTEKLLITGGTGFFGRALLRHFHAEAQRSPTACPQDYSEIIVISRNPEAFAVRYPELAQAPWLRWARANVVQRQTLDGLLVDETASAVLHAATDSTDAAALSPVEKLDQIVEGTRNVLDLAMRLKAHRFLLTSSGGVYGPQPEEMEHIQESYCGMPDPLHMSSTYGVGKRMAEHLCFLYGKRYGLETVIARCFAFVGQDLPLDAHFAIGNFMRDALYNPHIEIRGNGNTVRTYMDQRDLSRWLIKILKKGRVGEAYNVGSDEEITITNLARIVRDIIAPNKDIKNGVIELTLNQRNRYVPSINKAKNELDLYMHYSLNQAIINFKKQKKN